ncbi:hypothetical protein, partial [Desulfobacter postgatei]|uniref:hypothetical protein n=1 Tax=Desulfobacter postgatei TaxID=2293 RepID=UPI002A35FE55
MDEFNALLRSFEEALLESNQTLEGKERVNKPSIYKNSPFSSIADQLFLGAFPFSRFKKNLSFDAKIVVCFASQLSILSIINRCGANGMET